MENYDTYKQAISEAEKAEGTAARKMQAYNESVAYSINQLSAAWEGFAQKLEASPAVKGVYKFLTFLVEQLDHILQYLTPFIAAFNADKIVSLAKFLSPLVTAIPKTVGKGFKDRHGSEFYENMTQKMTAENTNAIEELTNATRDNTAALRGEKSKSGKVGTNKTNINNNGESKRVRPGSIQDLQNQIDTDEQYIQNWKSLGKDENDPIIQRLRERQAEKQKQILKKQMRSTRLTTGVVSGIGAGAVRFANKGSSFLDEAMGVSGVEVDTGEALAMGVAQGALTGVATAFMGPAGAVLASILGDFLSSLWKKLAHADEIARKERVEDAKKQLEAIKGIGNSVTGLIDLNKKDQALWDSDDWKQFNEQIETINEALKKSELGIIKLGNSTQTLSDYFAEAVRTGNRDMLARVEAERIRFEAEKTYAAGEQDRYTLQKEINENQKKLAKLDDDEISKQKELNAAIKAARAEIESYSEALKKGYMQASFYSSGVGTMEAYDIGNATLDRVIMQIARDWAKDSPDIFAGNQLTSDARSEIISYLREQPGYASLFKNDTKNVGDMLTARNAVGELREELSMSQKQLKEFANSKDLLKIGKRFKLIGDEINDINKLSEKDKSAVYKLIDKINLVDEDGITTIAHAMNMTVKEFEEANADGAFNWLTTDVAIGGIDKLNEKMQTFNDLLSAASEGSLLTSENLNKIANQFPTLLRGVNEAGKYTTDLSSDNILDNIIRMMTDEDSLREIYSGLFSGSMAKDSEIWSNFMTLGKGSEIATDSTLGQDIKERVKKAGSYSDIVDLFATDEMKEYNDAFKEYVTSMYPITDLLDTQAKILEEYGKHTLETEISNLESVRDSLDDVNKQREKELELIKAKEALENASKEKKRIYRAGVGFVYATDQEAVKSAQEKVDELERQRDKDNIQYQIDSLKQQKEILENIENNKQLESLIETAEKILDGDGSSGGIAGIIAAVNSITSEEFTNKIKEQIKAEIDESTNETKEEEKTNAGMDYRNAISEAKAFQDGKVFTGEYDDNGNPVFRPMSDEEKKEFGGQTPADIAKHPNSPYYAAAKEEEKKYIDKVVDARQKFTNLGGEVSSEDSFTGEKNGSIFTSERSNRVKITNEKGHIAAFEIGDYFDWEANTKQFNTSDKKGGAKVLRYAKQNPDGTFDTIQKFDNAENMTIKDAIDSLEGPAAIINSDNIDYIMYKGADGKTYQMHAWDFKRKKWEDPGFAGGYSSIWNIADYTYIRNKEEIKASDLIDMFIQGSSYASGTLSAPGGRSLINENGLESIITPSGTITSLPAKSGIVPADLTRNLWALGEVAPNLIARLGGNNLQTNNSNSVTDNSINISNLDATFYTEEGFDGEAFLRDLKSQVILTSNNH